MNRAARSLDEAKRNPGEQCTNHPGFRFASSRLPCYGHDES
ncbi:MAG: hypothetical protein ABW109_11265 [Candidatus Thiodiazotropha sp. 6PLUC4]